MKLCHIITRVRPVSSPRGPDALPFVANLAARFRRRQITRLEPTATRFVDIGIMLLEVIGCVIRELNVPSDGLRRCIEQDHIVIFSEPRQALRGVIMRTGSLPNQLVPKKAGSKN